MLQQILRDLYVDPDILAELDEQQKQNLFCKMREEQVRRWKAWTDEIDRETSAVSVEDRRSRRYKKVKFLNGADGEPWVWVMGEHANDKSIEEILRDEAIEKARRMAEREAEEIRKRVEAKITLELMDMAPKFEASPSDDIYCSVDELRDKMCSNRPMIGTNSNYSICHYQSKDRFNSFMESDVRAMHELSSLSKNKVAQRIALWERKLTEERTCEIFKTMQKKQMEIVKEAEEAAKRHEQLWLEQERKAKQAEKQIREIARKAREEHRLTSSMLKVDTSYYNVTSGIPPGRQAVMDWFKVYEAPRIKQQDFSIQPWFHGLITRKEAETLLQAQPEGNYLVRLSEKIWGYAISYRSSEKCKHYLVSAAEGSYCFLGNNQMEHKSLDALIAHHRLFPLSDGEKLQDACPRNEINNLGELFSS